MNIYEHLGSKKYYFIRVNQIYQYLRNCVKTSARRFPLWKTPQPVFASGMSIENAQRILFL